MQPVDISQIKRAAQLQPILVALSGGGDSSALLHLLKEAFGAERLRVCVVDHALRQASAEDANLAAERARALGVQTQIKTLAWPEGPKTSQAAFRAARYRALCEAARQSCAHVIALGHNADDQAETLMMRRESGSSWRGLAGMRALAPAPIWPEGRGLWLARPLLDHRRADLRKLLIEKGAAWIEDPANSNPDFARVRMRARLAEMEEGGFDPMSLCAEALAHQSRAEAQDEAARILLAGACALKHGEAALDKTAWLNAEPETRRRALSVLIAAIAGAEREAPSDAIARLDDAMARPDFSGAALGGALVRPGFKLGRDPGAILGRADGARPAAPLILPQARPVIWDNRVEITAARAGSQIVPGPRGCPLLERAHAVQALADAEAAGEIRAHWLTEAHIAQLLPSENAAFTPS